MPYLLDCVTTAEGLDGLDNLLRQLLAAGFSDPTPEQIKEAARWAVDQGMTDCYCGLPDCEAGQAIRAEVARRKQQAQSADGLSQEDVYGAIRGALLNPAVLSVQTKAYANALMSETGQAALTNAFEQALASEATHNAMATAVANGYLKARQYEREHTWHYRFGHWLRRQGLRAIRAMIGLLFLAIRTLLYGILHIAGFFGAIVHWRRVQEILDTQRELRKAFQFYGPTQDPEAGMPISVRYGYRIGRAINSLWERRPRPVAAIQRAVATNRMVTKLYAELAARWPRRSSK